MTRDAPAREEHGLFTPAFWEAVVTHRLEREGRAVMRAVTLLQDRTGWNDEEIGVHLGCRPDSIARQPRHEALRRLRFSADYLAWLRELAGVMGDPQVTRFQRDIVRCARELHGGAGGGDAADRLRACQIAFRQTEGVAWPAEDYLRCGEVRRAFEVAALSLPADAPAHAAAARAAAASAPLASLRPHVHPARVQAAYRSDAATTLGVSVRDAIRGHVGGGCPVCAAAAPHLATELKIPA
ncbi:hypothetical protein [Conexibacter arvalis]|uniref:hypothetical protein n=1 Tax=Conexibacter arvalis TaxID=912552 RepID=UPI00160DB201|nr:hypothetical protein [Conexibacter arvalis]